MVKMRTFSVVSVLAVLCAWFCVSGIPVSKAGGGDAVKLYMTHCKACHGDNGKPTELGAALEARDLADAKWQSTVTDEKIIKQIEDGTPEKMMPFKAKLTKEEINSLVPVVRSFGKK